MPSDDQDKDKTLLYLALSGYANWIETDDFLMSARDAQERGVRFKALEPSQMRRVLRLREMAEVILRYEHDFRVVDLKTLCLGVVASSAGPIEEDPDV